MQTGDAKYFGCSLYGQASNTLVYISNYMCYRPLWWCDAVFFFSFTFCKKLTKAQKAQLKKEEEERKLREQGHLEA